MRKKSSVKTSGRLWPTAAANKLTPQAIDPADIVNADGTPWTLRNKPHDRRHGGQIQTTLADAVRLSTPTSSPSTATNTPESPLLPAGFLASHFPVPGSDEARRTTARSGRRCSALLKRQDPVGCLLKTCLESSAWNSTLCFLTWRAKATPRGRWLFQLAPSMPDTDETGCGYLLPTP